MSRRTQPLRRYVDQFLAETGKVEPLESAPLAAELVEWLTALAEDGDTLAQITLDTMRQEGAEKWVRDAIGHRVPFKDPTTGQVLAGRTRAGVPARDEQGARLGHWQQPLFVAMRRHEFRDWLAARRAERATATAYVALGSRIERAWSDYPTAATVAEVCDLAGIDLPAELLEAV